jgi:hypothetical protein
MLWGAVAEYDGHSLGRRWQGHFTGRTVGCQRRTGEHH